ncbi:MAG: hypothetical protein HZA79_11340 [Sphingobacteriales bacterium]|nr:hypothetical protein [Sphingobacteriales bacterium]
MKRKLLLFVIFTALLRNGNSQAPADLLLQWYQRAPLEKIWLHFDRDNYLAGETAWFKAYLYSDYQPDTISSVLYVELLNESSVILSRKVLPVMLASTYGQFELPDTLVTGMYLVRAYTPTMLNNGIDYVYKKKLFIFGKKPVKTEPAVTTHTILLDFFPEGGNLVSGFTNTIAYKATDEKGLPVNISGTINNSKGQEVASFSSYHDGMGMFELAPEAGEQYTARLNDAVPGKTYPLPVAAEKGVVFSIIPHPQGGFFEIHQRTDNPSLRAAYMIGQMQHHVLFRQELPAAKDETQGVLNTEKLNSGIMQVTVFTREGLPLAERLFFVNNKEYIRAAELRTDTLSFAEKGRNHFKILIKDTVQGSLSVSITDADYALSPQRPENIFSGLLLTADLRGYIHNPAWYLSSEDDSVKTAADLLMMTHGWRRFRWEELANKVKQPLPFADPSYITVTGRITLGGTNRGFSEKPLLALITAEGMRRNAQFITTDKQGNFKLDSLLFFGDARIFILDIRGKKSQYIDVKMTSDTLGRTYPVALPGPSFFAGASLPGQQQKMADDFDAIRKANGLMLEEITLKVKKKNPTDLLDEQYTRGAFSGTAEKTIDLVNSEEFATEANIFDYLQLRIPGLDVATDGNEYKLYYRQGPTISSLGPIPMTVYLNEIETDATVIATLPPSEIALVKLYSTFIGATGGGAGGAMAIYTRKGADITSSSRGDLITYQGFSVVKEFYVPDYKTDHSLLFKPDTRITLDWRPNIFVNNVNPVIPVSFYNSDRTKRFRVVVEGMTTSGKLISLEKIISK